MTNVYQIITDRIVGALEQGSIPWQKPWAGGAAGIPRNIVSRKPYRGVNVFILGFQRYASPWWMSFKQAKDMGGSVRKGEKGSPCVFWSFVERRDDETGELKRIPFLRYYTVFNIAQVDGIDPKRVPEVPGVTAITPLDFTAIDAAEAIVRGFAGAPEVQYGMAGAFYRPATDSVGMPERATFRGVEEYYSTLFHEFTHATGHKSRLNREGIQESGCFFGSQVYSREELVAEMGAAFLCGIAGIENRTVDNSAAYIKGWLKKLGEDPKAVVVAAAQAQRAAEWIQGIRYEKGEEAPEGEMSLPVAA